MVSLCAYLLGIALEFLALPGMVQATSIVLTVAWATMVAAVVLTDRLGRTVLLERPSRHISRVALFLIDPRKLAGSRAFARVAWFYLGVPA